MLVGRDCVAPGRSHRVSVALLRSMQCAHKMQRVSIRTTDRRRRRRIPGISGVRAYVCMCVCVEWDGSPPLVAGSQWPVVKATAALPISGPRSTEICLLSHIINEFIVFARAHARAGFFSGLSLCTLYLYTRYILSEWDPDRNRQPLTVSDAHGTDA